MKKGAADGKRFLNFISTFYPWEVGSGRAGSRQHQDRWRCDVYENEK